MEAKGIPELGGGEEKLLVSDEVTVSGAVTIAPTDMNGNAVMLTNDTEQVRSPQRPCWQTRCVCVCACRPDNQDTSF